ncbi:MAG: ABC transporter permease subunit [Spirochaetaceae bacterium]|nr:ABC transporter permease subunit [Spirochaetaceae bacterium]
MSEQMMVAAEGAKRGAGARGTFLKEVYRHREYLLLLLPALVIFVLFRYIPMAGIVIAFKKYTIAGGLFGSPWVGFTYFERLFDSEKFYQVLWNSIRISFLKIAIGFPGPIIFALLLNEVRQVAWKKSFQTISYLPHFVSWVVVGGIVRDVLSVHGVVNGMMGFFGAEPRLFLQEMHSFLPIVITSMIWKNIGWGSIIYLAAITSIDPDLYEAAEIDGAGRVRRMWHITLPSITHVIIILFLLRIGNILEAGFDQIFNLYNPLVYDVADIIDTYVYREGISGFQYSLTAAASLFQNLVGLMLLLMVNVVTRRMQADYSVV